MSWFATGAEAVAARPSRNEGPARGTGGGVEGTRDSGGGRKGRLMGRRDWGEGIENADPERYEAGTVPSQLTASIDSHA